MVHVTWNVQQPGALPPHLGPPCRADGLPGWEPASLCGAGLWAGRLKGHRGRRVSRRQADLSIPRPFPSVWIVGSFFHFWENSPWNFGGAGLGPTEPVGVTDALTPTASDAPSPQLASCAARAGLPAHGSFSRDFTGIVSFIVSLGRASLTGRNTTESHARALCPEDPLRLLASSGSCPWVPRILRPWSRHRPRDTCPVRTACLPAWWLRPGLRTGAASGWPLLRAALKDPRGVHPRPGWLSCPLT